MWPLVQEEVHDVLVNPLVRFRNALVLGVLWFLFEADKRWWCDCFLDLDNVNHAFFIEIAMDFLFRRWISWDFLLRHVLWTHDSFADDFVLELAFDFSSSAWSFTQWFNEESKVEVLPSGLLLLRAWLLRRLWLAVLMRSFGLNNFFHARQSKVEVVFLKALQHLEL